MNSWKEAFHLAMFEIRASILYIFITLPLLLIIALFFVTSFPNYIDKNYIGFDLLFILLFSIFPSWLRAKPFQYQKVRGELWASPPYIMQLQLPIPIDILSKSRIITHVIVSLPIQIILLVIIYFFTPYMQTTMLPSSYVAFAIIWLSFNVYAGSIMPASDVGDYITFKTMVISLFILFSIFMGAALMFYFIVGSGFVYWTMQLAIKVPLICIIVSLLLVVVSFRYWSKMMYKKTKKLDYL